MNVGCHFGSTQTPYNISSYLKDNAVVLVNFFILQSEQKMIRLFIVYQALLLALMRSLP